MHLRAFASAQKQPNSSCSTFGWVSSNQVGYCWIWNVGGMQELEAILLRSRLSVRLCNEKSTVSWTFFFLCVLFKDFVLIKAIKFSKSSPDERPSNLRNKRMFSHCASNNRLGILPLLFQTITCIRAEFVRFPLSCLFHFDVPFQLVARLLQFHETK